MGKVLGKGLAALIKENNIDEKSTYLEVLITSITTNKHQPRKNFNNKEMKNLIHSIKSKGIIQPLTIRKTSNNKYELIAGERRFRAAKELNLKKVPVFILDIKTESEMMEYALIENIQRVDLNPIEEAEGYFLLKDKYHYTQNKIATQVSKSRSEISNKLRLLKLPLIIKTGLQNNLIHYAHARSLLGIKNIQLMIKIYKNIIKKQLNARETELLIKNLNYSKTDNKHQKLSLRLYKDEQYLYKKLQSKILIELHETGRGKISIKCDSKQKLNKIIYLLKK